MEEIKRIGTYVTRLCHNLLIKQIITDVYIDSTKENDVIVIEQFRKDLMGQKKEFAKTAIRKDDISKIRISKAYLVDQLPMECLNGMLNLFIQACLILAAQKLVDGSLLQLTASLLLYFEQFKRLIIWVYGQFIKGIKTLIINTKNKRSIEIIYSDELQAVLNGIAIENNKYS